MLRVSAYREAALKNADAEPDLDAEVKALPAPITKPSDGHEEANEAVLMTNAVAIAKTIDFISDSHCPKTHFALTLEKSQAGQSVMRLCHSLWEFLDPKHDKWNTPIHSD